MSGFLESHGPKLQKRLYNLVPIAQGKKAPNLKRWQTFESSPVLVKAWINKYKGTAAGVGILTAQFPAIDIDVEDEEIVDKVFEFIKSRHDVAFYRQGQPPRLLIPFRLGGNPAFRKLASAKYADEFDVEHRVEVLAEGQQYVAYHTHPDTHQPYTWFDPTGLPCDGPIALSSQRLPTLSLGEAEDVIDYFQELAENTAGFRRVTSRKSSGHIDPDDPFASVPAEPLDLSDAKIKAVMKKMQRHEAVDDYDGWLKVGAALHHQFEGAPEGLELFDEWSSVSPSYQGFADCETKWESFSKSRGNGMVTFASVLQMAKDIKGVAEPKPQTDDLDDDWGTNDDGYDKGENARDHIADVRQAEFDAAKRSSDIGVYEADVIDTMDDDDFLERFVHGPGGKVYDLQMAANVDPMKLDDFKNYFAEQCEERVVYDSKGEPKLDGDGYEKTKMVSLAQVWQRSKYRHRVIGEVFRPGAGRLLGPTGARVINRCHIPPVDMDLEIDEERLEIWQEHIDYLFPVEKERDWFHKWIAISLQFPQKRCPVTPLHISLAHRTGRGFVVKVLRALIGKHNITKAKIESMVGERKSQYTDYLNRSLFCFVEEVYDGKKRYGITDEMRDILTEDSLNLNLKYGSNGTYDVFCNFFMMSNHADALVLPPDDERIHVLTGPTKSRGPQWFDQLYAWLEDPENIWHLRAWYHQMEVKWAAPEFQNAPRTEGRERMMALSTSESDMRIQSVLDNFEGNWATIKELVDLANEGRTGAREQISNRHMTAYLREQRIMSKPVGVEADGTLRQIRVPERPGEKASKLNFWPITPGALTMTTTKIRNEYLNRCNKIDEEFE